MREFSDEPLDKQRQYYLTQDDNNSDTRAKFIPKILRDKKFDDSEDDEIPRKIKHFTPGRIRPSRAKKDNFVRSPNNGGRLDLLQTQ